MLPSCFIVLSLVLLVYAEDKNEDCFEVDIDYLGMEYLHVEKFQSASACAQLCKVQDQCLAWTWIAKPTRGQPAQRCWLKNGVARPSNLVGVVSGRKGCRDEQSLQGIFQTSIKKENLTTFLFFFQY